MGKCGFATGDRPKKRGHHFGRKVPESENPAPTVKHSAIKRSVKLDFWTRGGGSVHWANSGVKKQLHLFPYYGSANQQAGGGHMNSLPIAPQKSEVQIPDLAVGGNLLPSNSLLLLTYRGLM